MLVVYLFKCFDVHFPGFRIAVGISKATMWYHAYYHLISVSSVPTSKIQVFVVGSMPEYEFLVESRIHSLSRHAVILNWHFFGCF